MRKRVDLFEDKLKGTKNRKRKSVAKLMKENIIVEPSTKKKKMKSVVYSTSSTNKVSRFKNGDDEDHEKALDNNSLPRKKKKKKKKSKYLSHPYTNLNQTIEILSSKRDMTAESMKISKITSVGERINSAATRLTESSPILKKTFSRKSDNKKVVSPKRVITLVHSAALNPHKFMGSDAHEMINDFMYAYRSAVYKNGSNYKPLCKKSYRPGLGSNDQNETVI